MAAKGWIAAGVGVVVLGGGGYLLYRGGDLKSLGLPGPTGAATVTSGLAITLAAPDAGTQVTGPSPGARGETLYPSLWALAPQALPTAGYAGGPPITRPEGVVYVVIATDLQVSGTYDGENAADLGPWVGIAEYSDGQLVRVYPQLNTGANAISTLGAWSGGYSG